MPLVRITHAPETDAVAVSRAVHRALQTHFNVPADDYFHVLEATGAGRRFLRADGYLGHSYTEAAVLIEITCAMGRSTAQKQALYCAITEDVASGAGARPDDVIVIITENTRPDWCFGGGAAAYV